MSEDEKIIEAVREFNKTFPLPIRYYIKDDGSVLDCYPEKENKSENG